MCISHWIFISCSFQVYIKLYPYLHLFKFGYSSKPVSIIDMKPIRNKFIRIVLMNNIIVDLFASLALFFLVFHIPLPGYNSYTGELAFIEGGWGIAVLTFGIGRILASNKPEYYRLMTILGLVEVMTLCIFCLINVTFLGINFLQAMLPLAIGSVYGGLYLITISTQMKINIYK